MPAVLPQLDASMSNKCSAAYPPRARQQGSFRLPIAPATAFDLFTAKGEREWVDGWEPVILSPCGATAPGAVFLTGHSGEETIWTVIEADRELGRLMYSRVSPGRRAGTVAVELEPAAEGTCVRVAYDLTALSLEGEAAVLAMGPSGFAAMLEEWERLIRNALEKR